MVLGPAFMGKSIKGANVFLVWVGKIKILDN